MNKLLIALTFLVAIASSSTSATAGSAQLLLDARTGEVLASENPDSLNHPASLTKMMTLYMTFDAIRRGELSWDSKVPFSKYAASRPPTKLRVKAGDAVTAGQTLELTGTYNAVSGSRLKAGTQAQIRARLLFNGRNLVDGSDAEVEVWEAVLAPTNPIDFMSDKLVDITLTGKMVTPAGKDAPYEVRLPKLA